MEDQKNSNQVVRELKWLDVKEPDLSIINIQELRGRNVNEELHASSIRPLPPGPVYVQGTVQTFNKKTSAYHHQSVKHQEEAVDEPLRTVVQTFIQALLMTIGGTPNSNTGSNNDAHDEIMDRQPASTLNATDNQGQSMPPQKDSYDTDPNGPNWERPNHKFQKNQASYHGHRCITTYPWTM